MAFASEQLSCPTCLTLPPPYRQGRSAFIYRNTGRDLVLQLKHSDATYLPDGFAPWLVLSGAEFWKKADYIIPVPLHRWRMVQRQYNQSTLLARALSRRVNIPTLTNCLVRIKATQSQGHKSVKERRANVKHAFDVHNPEIIQGKCIVLIDDVWTTGATIHACCDTLAKAGAKEVNVLTLARVVKD